MCVFTVAVYNTRDKLRCQAISAPAIIISRPPPAPYPPERLTGISGEMETLYNSRQMYNPVTADDKKNIIVPKRYS